MADSDGSDGEGVVIDRDLLESIHEKPDRLTRPWASVITMDPALRKLLDELPADDPDKEPMAEVWIALCDQRCMVPLNTPTEVDFGEWYGPPMPLNDVLIHARIGESRGCTHWDAPADAWVAPRCRITATITVRTC